MRVPCVDRAVTPARLSTMPARLVKVPPEPITCAPRQSFTGIALRSPSRTCSRSVRTARGRTSGCRKRSVRRTAPYGSEATRSISPSLASTSSSEPPPMSITSERPRAELEVRERAPEAEQRLLLAGEHAHREPGLLEDAAGEVGAVGGVAHGARGDDLDALGAELCARGWPCAARAATPTSIAVRRARRCPRARRRAAAWPSSRPPRGSARWRTRRRRSAARSSSRCRWRRSAAAGRHPRRAGRRSRRRSGRRGRRRSCRAGPAEGACHRWMMRRRVAGRQPRPAPRALSDPRRPRRTDGGSACPRPRRRRSRRCWSPGPPRARGCARRAAAPARR